MIADGLVVYLLIASFIHLFIFNFFICSFSFLVQGLLVMTTANLVTLVTAISMSAVATNGQIKGKIKIKNISMVCFIIRHAKFGIRVSYLFPRFIHCAHTSFYPIHLLCSILHGLNNGLNNVANFFLTQFSQEYSFSQ